MKKILAKLAAGFMMFGAVGGASAALLTFDDIPGVSQNYFGTIGSYGGFDFSNNLDWIDTVNPVFNYGAVSGRYTMLNNYGGAGVIVATSGDEFTFDGLYARTWAEFTRDGNIEGWNKGSLTWTINMTLTPTWTSFSGHSALIDELRLNLGNHFLVDNLALNEFQSYPEPPTTNPVPEPTTMLLFGAGLAGLAAVGRRRKAENQ